MRGKRDHHAAYQPPAFELADAMAVKHVGKGDADEHQQRRAIDWILYGILGVKQSPYDPDSTRNTDYAIGRQDAAREIALYMALPADQLKELAERRNPTRKVKNG